jgi:hypothetical protein
MSGNLACSKIRWNIWVRFLSFFGWGETESTRYVGHCWPIVPAPDDMWWWLWSSWWNEDWQGKPKYSEKTCPSATFSTTNPTWPDLGSNPGRRCGKPATNRLSYSTAMSAVSPNILTEIRGKCSMTLCIVISVLLPRIVTCRICYSTVYWPCSLNWLVLHLCLQ